MPDDFNSSALSQSGRRFCPLSCDRLYAFVGKHGVGREANPPFVYSNLGFALLGEALAARAGGSYRGTGGATDHRPAGDERHGCRVAAGRPAALDPGVRRPLRARSAVGNGRVRTGRRHQLNRRRPADLSGSAVARRFARSSVVSPASRRRIPWHSHRSRLALRRGHRNLHGTPETFRDMPATRFSIPRAAMPELSWQTRGSQSSPVFCRCTSSSGWRANRRSRSPR